VRLEYIHGCLTGFSLVCFGFMNLRSLGFIVLIALSDELGCFKQIEVYF